MSVSRQTAGAREAGPAALGETQPWGKHWAEAQVFIRGSTACFPGSYSWRGGMVSPDNVSLSCTWTYCT